MSDDPISADPAWSSTARFLEGRIAPGQRVTAPAPFARVTGPLTPPDATTLPDWAVIHKGELESVPAPLLRQLMSQSTPVFANDVFVVFARRPTFGLTNQRGSVHVNALVERLAMLGASPADPRPASPTAPGRTAPPAPLEAAPPAPASTPPWSAPSWAVQPKPAESVAAAPVPGWQPPAPGEPSPPAAGTVAPTPLPSWAAPPAPVPLTDAPPTATGDPGSPRPFGTFPPEAAALGAPTSLRDVPPATATVPAHLSPTGLAHRLAGLLGGPPPVHAVDIGGTDLAAQAFPSASASPDGANHAVVVRIGDPAALTGSIEEGLRRLGPSGHLLIVAENAGSLGRRLATAAGRTGTGGVHLAELLGALRAAGLRPSRAEGFSLDPWRAWADDAPAHQAAGAGAIALEEAGREAGPDHAAFLLVAARRA